MRSSRKQKTVKVSGHPKTSCRGKAFTVGKYFRSPPTRKRRKRRKIPARQVRTLVQLADGSTEVGGNIDFLPNQPGVASMTVHQGRSGEIELPLDSHQEIQWHTHPTQNKIKTLDPRLENLRQQSPSPGDVLRLIETQYDNPDSLIILPDRKDDPEDGKIIHYSTTDQTPLPSKALEHELLEDYNQINREGNTISGTYLDRMRYRDKEWKKLLKHKYHLYLKENPPESYKHGLVVYVKDVKA